MKILVIAPEVFPVPPIRGGAVETIIEEVTSRLKSSDVHILSPGDAELPDFEKPDHRAYYRKSWNAFDRLLLSSWKLPFKKSGSKWYYRPYSRWIQSKVLEIKPEVIWLHTRIQFVPWIRKTAPHARLVLSLHNESNLRDAEIWSEENIAACDLITCCSQSLAETAVKKVPALKNKIRVLFNGVDFDRFRPFWEQADRREELRRARGLTDSTVILYAGRLVEEKGVHVLLEAMEKILKKHAAINAGMRVAALSPRMAEAGDAGEAAVNFKLLIAGAHTFSDNRPTPYIEKLKKQAEALGSRVEFLGHVPQDQMPSYYLMSDILAFPSIWKEPFGMTLVEGMASGLPAVAFNQGGPAELITPRVDGLLARSEEKAQGLAQALELLIHNPVIRTSLGREAAQRARTRFGWERIASDLNLLLEEIREIKGPILIAESGSGFGGTAKYLKGLLPYLKNGKFDIRIVSYGTGPLIKEIQNQGWCVEYQESWRYPWSKIKQNRPKNKLESLLRKIQDVLLAALQILFLVPAIAAWLKKRKIKVVHLNNEVLSHLPMLIAAAFLGAKTICHLHGWRPFTKTEKFFLPFVDELVSISEAGSRYYETLLPGWKVRAVPNGLFSYEEFQLAPDKRAAFRAHHGIAEEDQVFLLAGRLLPWKGQEVFIRALANAYRKQPRVFGVIAGHDPSGGVYLEVLKKLSKEAGIEGRIIFMPFQKELDEVYAACDYVVHASTRPEPFGLVILEAMAAMKPVIATAAGGVLDIVIHGSTGLLVKPGSEIPMTEAMIELVSKPDLARSLAQAAKLRAETLFTMERNAEKIGGLYNELLAQRKTS